MEKEINDLLAAVAAVVAVNAPWAEKRGAIEKAAAGDTNWEEFIGWWDVESE